MKKYEYVTIQYEANSLLFLGTMKHKEIIDKYAEQGYRYVGFIPTKLDGHGSLRNIDLIFEKDDEL